MKRLIQAALLGLIGYSQAKTDCYKESDEWYPISSFKESSKESFFDSRTDLKDHRLSGVLVCVVNNEVAGVRNQIGVPQTTGYKQIYSVTSVGRTENCD